MSDAPHSQPNLDETIDDCQFDYILSQLEQQRSFQQQVVTALTEANAAFAAQCTDPNGYRFMTACDDLLRFLNFKIPMGYPEQKLLMQVLQIACAMHENAANNPTLTPVQRSSHQLATTSLLPLCRTALEHHITDLDIWSKVCQVAERAQQAHAKATDALDISKYLDFDCDNSEDDLLSMSEKDTGLLSPSPSTTPSSPPPVSEPAESRGSAPATATGTRRTTRSSKRKEQALAMTRDKPYKLSLLRRSHTAPNLLQTRRSRRHASLDALEEMEE